MQRFDVAVIGAGPAGSSTAITLAGLGCTVVLLDRARFPRNKLCGDFLNPINWPVLEDLGVADAVRDCNHVKVSGFSVSSASGQKAACALPPQDALHSGLGIQRYFLDDALINRARQLGVTVQEDCKVLAISRETPGWAINCRTSEGDEIRRAPMLVGADGRNSKVARELKLDTPAAQKRGSVGFQMRLKLASGIEDSVQVYHFRGGYAGVVRIDSDTINIAFTIARSSLRDTISFQALRKQYLEQNSALRELLFHSEPCSKLRSIWPVYFPARRSYGDGFVLVGDAAQVTEPVTGEGIYFALKSGQLAARSIADALRNPKSSRLALARYESACHKELGKRTRLNKCLRSLMRHPALLDAAVFLLRWRKELLEALLRQVCGGASHRGAAA